MDLSLLKKIRCRFLDRSTGKPVPGVIASLSVVVGDAPNLAHLPVGTLSTDATGYMSFDLKPLTDLGLATASGFFISAPKFALMNYDLLGSLFRASDDEAENVDVRESLALSVSGWLSAASTTDERKERPCIVFPIYLEDCACNEHESECASRETIRLPSIQSPDIYDYRVSPFSFVTPTALSLGNDGCEILLPSSQPLQQYRFYKVVVRREEARPESDGIAHEVQVSNPLGSLARTPVIKFGEVLEYRQEWYSLGHSLGEIKYSLPLAPGESTQLAIIEWSRDDVASRTDQIRATEYLDHDSRRDRAIEETVEAALREEQGGNSHMGSTSGTGGGTWGVPGVWGAGVTGNHAFGGGISYSYGKRNVEGESLQSLHDRVRQASASVRSLNSTVIVQASQKESNALHTRRVANHNHCHAMTIQYYEVLRHYRMSTRFSGQRQAVLIPFALFSLDTWERALRFRTVLEQALLDSSLSNCFEALIRLHKAPATVYDVPVPPKPSGPGSNTTVEPVLLEASVNVLASKGKGMKSGVDVRKGDKIKMVASGLLAVSGGNGYGSGGFPPEGDGNTTPEGTGHFPFLAPGLQDFSLIYKIGVADKWRQFEAQVTADKNGEVILGVNTLPNGFADFNNAAAPYWTVALEYPSHEDVPTPTDPSKDDVAPRTTAQFRKPDDELCEARLIEHLKSNQGFYNSAVWVLMDAVERRIYLEAALSNRPEILDGMDDRPIAISGNYVAFEYTDPSSSSSQPRVPVEDIEDIVTLPTRGLFAEAQLGHCNSCEMRDVTRMWDWTEMTVETPPEISGISPGPKGQAPSISQGQLPTNVIQITQPQAAPDPTGLASALAVLKTPDIFRDMAGLEEVSQLLGELAKASGDAYSKSMVAAAQERIEKMKLDAKSGAGSAGSSARQTPEERYDNLQVAKEVAKSADELGLDDQQKSELSQDIIGGGGGGKLTQFLKTILSAFPATKTARVTTFNPNTRACCALGQWEFGASGELDPTALGGHRYGGGTLGGGPVGYVYTARAGLVDLGHLRDLADMTKFIYEAMDSGCTKLELYEGTATVHTMPSDKKSIIELAGAIAYVESWAHELTTWDDYSSFSPEDVPSNIIGIEIAKRALKTSGSYDAAMDTILDAMINGELLARSKANTKSVLTKIKNKWYALTVGLVPLKLIRRNFDGTPWMAGMPYDAPVSLPWLNPAAFAANYAMFDYAISNKVDGKSGVTLATMKATTDAIRATFVAANPGMDSS